MQEFVVGIDLGTTNSLIGTIIDGKPTLFGDESGAELLPSVVGIGADGVLLVGRAARNRRILDPHGTAVSIKRQMGKNARVRVGQRELSPEEISALILGALLDRAEKRLGVRPTRAVITVPAYFDDAQRQATRNAGEIAGLHIERLVNEPTAAAMSYHTGQEQRVMVYDLGGGTFDVSVLDRDEGFLEVKASRGDTHLGGDDIDTAIRDLVLERLGESRHHVEKDAQAMTRLIEAVERAKIALSDREEVRLFDPFLAGEGDRAVHLDMPLTREDVEQVATPLVQRTLRCIDDALRDAKSTASDLDRVLLVGGSSKMPLVARMVSAHLGRPVQVDLDADRAVALGASTLAGRAGGVDIDEVLVDITPHSLAVGALEDEEMMGADDEDLLAVPIIERDTVVPVEKTRTFYTSVENQSGILVPIVQGEAELVGDNTPLGTVRVSDLPPSPAMSPVAVTFRLDLSGVLHVVALHVPSGRAATITIADSPYRLTEQTRQASRAKVQDLRALKAPAELEAGGTAPDGTTPGGAASSGTASESDLALAKAMLARAAKALEKNQSLDEAIRARVVEVRDELSRAIENRASDIQASIEKLTDALLDLV